MASTRAEDVAEILWELKRAGKLATFSTIAGRAGFSAGSNGRAMHTCLRTVRRDWPHLQWWRAVEDSGNVEKGSEQETCLEDAGFPTEKVDDTNVTVKSADEVLMTWEEGDDAAVA